ncbi:bifunctional UDP-sugar hydrolase/5'-nucleotidase [Eubacterium sp. 1001713B170207_170306_E7]|uniref:bifunctional metallophosphatase/5'-nucleotidase n=1 Tax=Eubacterium sp. 1001713B170207_170306_E7 TaxID=2787097 RepID=UPI0018976139|nr:bifunctional UDP-sugar hydrolase/5'-nucleotidase [Eubacterium sp. 1001713B170207_170306_E7]
MKPRKSLIILTTNDLHGALVSSPGVIGADYTAALKKYYKDALLLDAGDAIQGSALAALSKGRDVITLMNAAGYDAMAAGNHEFGYGFDTLVANARRADFPILSANSFRDKKTLLAGEAYSRGHKINNGAYTLLKRQGITIGIFGLTTPETANGAGQEEPKEMRGIRFKSPLHISRETIKKLKELGADIIICLAHLGIDPGSAPENQSVGLAEALGENSGLDIIIDGHSHSVFEEKRINGILLQQSGSGAQRIGKITIDPETHETSGVFLEAETVRKSCRPDKKVARLADRLVNGYAAKLSPVVAQIRTTLWGGTVNGINEARIAETNLGDVITDAMADAARERFKNQMTGSCIFEAVPVIALHNGGGIRASLHPGQITAGDCLDVLPFGNRIYFREATPKILYQALENGVSRVRGQNPETGRIIGAGGGFP